ncbi:MAG: short chain dehydrogenase [Myxococcales bacterium]
MRILVVGATGTIGKAVAEALAGRHEVVRASRHGEVKLDLEAPHTLSDALRGAGPLDAVVCCAGNARFKPLEQLGDEDFAYSLRSKLMGQVNLARAAFGVLRDGGSVTLTSGVLARKPSPGSAAISVVNAGVEAFARAAALELPRGLRINVVSPPWVSETLKAMGMDPSGGLPAERVARAYVEAVEGRRQGETLEP